MALKIEFSASFRDAESTLKILNELNKEVETLNKHVGDVGGNGTRAFTELTKSIEAFQKSTKSVESLKELNKSLSELTSRQNDISTFSKTFTELGKAMNTGLGFATDQMVGGFKRTLDQLKAEAADAGKKLQESLKTVNDESADETTRKQARTEAAAWATNLSQRQSDIDALESDLFWNQPRSFLGGGNLSNFATAATATAGAVGLGLTAVNAATNFGVELEQRRILSDITTRNEAMDIGKQAASGEITPALLASAGLGEEAAYKRGERPFQSFQTSWLGNQILALGSGFRAGIGSAIGGATVGGAAGAAFAGIGAIPGAIGGAAIGLVSGGMDAYKSAGGFKTAEQLESEKTQELRSLDMAKFKDAFTPGWARYQSAYQSNRDLFASQGDKSVMDTLEGLNRRGISDARAIPVMDQLDKYGYSLGGSIERMEGGIYVENLKDRIYRVQKDLGLSGNVMNELIRSGQGTNASVREFDNALGSTGLTNRRALSTAAEGYAGIMAQNAAGYSEAMGAYSPVNAGIQAIMANSNGRVSEVEAAMGANMMAQKAQGQYGSAASLAGSSMEMELIRLGVDDPLVRAGLRKEMSAGNWDRVSKIIASGTGKDENEVLKQLNANRERTSDLQKRITAVDDKWTKAGEEAGVSFGGYLLTNDARGGQLQLDKALQAATKGQGGVVGPLMASSRKQATEGERYEEEMSARISSEQLAALREVKQTLGDTTMNAIAQGFERMAEELRKSTNEFKGGARTQSAPTTPITGTKKTQNR